jgi:integron integrase
MNITSIPKILVISRREIRISHLSVQTEKAYLDWIFRFLMFHDIQKHTELTEKEVNIFLSFLAVRKQASSSTQNQALHAILFLYRKVFNINVSHINYIRVKKSHNLPNVFTLDEIRKILDHLSGEKKLIVSLLYGCGLNLNECLSLRIQDVNLDLNILHIRNYRTQKTRELFIQNKLREEFKLRIEALRYRHMRLSINKNCGVTVPGTILKTAPETCQDFSWFYLFPGVKPVKKNKNGTEIYHHRSETYIQKAVRKILKNHLLSKSASCRSFRHSFATHLLKEGIDIYDLQKLLGHKNIRNTLTYKLILQSQSQISGSPLDSL